MASAVEIRNLTMSFKKTARLRDLFNTEQEIVTALDGISLDIKSGEIFGLLGPNGAGKTTLIKVLSNLLIPQEGSATIYGHDVVREEWKIKELIGLIHSDERSFFWRLTGRQNLEFFSALFKVPKHQSKAKIEELFALVDLEPHADKPFQKYSTGMKQRLAIARGLLSSPRVLFMDEPMRAIDPISTQKIRDFIRQRALEITNGTIILATNRLDEAAYLCDRVAIINQGKVVQTGSMEEIQAKYSTSIAYKFITRRMQDTLIDELGELASVSHATQETLEDDFFELTIRLNSEEEDLQEILAKLVEKKIDIVRCERQQSSLEELFSTVINESSKL